MLPIITHWKSLNFEAEGWLVIDSLTNGVCGGGTFMHSHTTLKEVKELSKNMTIKNQLNEIPFGGAKAGIRYEHTHKNAPDVLEEFLTFCSPWLENVWSTGADLNTNTTDIERIIIKLDLTSSFYAIGEMYANYLNIKNQSHNLQKRISKKINEYFTLEKSVVGYSITEILKTMFPTPLKVIIQGFGKIGASLAYYLAKNEFIDIVAIIDISGALISEAGIDVCSLLDIQKQTHESRLLKNIYSLYQTRHNVIWLPADSENSDQPLIDTLSSIQANCVAFCANRYAITSTVLDIMIKHTFSESIPKIIISGANLPFTNANLIEQARANDITVLPCWLTSAGNSLLYGEALRCQHYDKNWPKYIMNKISSILIKKIASIITTI